MGLAKQDNNERIWMLAANFCNFVGGMAITRPNLPKVFARHAIEPVNRFAMFAGCHQQCIKRLPIVSPVHIEADSPAQLSFIDLPSPPLFDDTLISRKNSFNREHNRTISGIRQCL